MNNFSGYINVPIYTDPNILAQDALTNLTNQIPGWIPQEGNLEVLLMEEFATMAAQAAAAASTVPADIFMYYGNLVGITQNIGSYAQIQTTWTLFAAAPSDGVTILAGTLAGFIYQNIPYLYQVQNTFTIGSGNSSQSNVVMQAVAPGIAYNGNGNPATISINTTQLTLQTSNPLVQSIVVTSTPFAGVNMSSLTAGVDAESQTSYLNRLSTEIALMAPRPITPSDFAQISQNISPVYRAYSTDGIDAFANLLTPNDSNLTTATTNNYVAIGDGTHTPTLSLSSAGLTITAAAMTSTTLASAVTTTPPNAFSTGTANTFTVATGSVLGSGVSTSNPALVKVSDFTSFSGLTTTLGGTTVSGTTTGITAGMFVEGPGIIAGTTVASVTTGSLVLSQAATKSVSSGSFFFGFGNEIIVVTGVSSNTWTIKQGTWFGYAHNSGVTLTPLQGVQMPAPITSIANSDWFQTAAVVECGTDITGSQTYGPGQPYVVSVITTYDGSVNVYSSLYPIADTLYDYNNLPKTVVCTPSAQSLFAIAPGNTSTYYGNITGKATSVINYIVWSNATSTKTHKILYSSFNMTSNEYTQYFNDSPWNQQSNINWVIDNDLNSAYYPNSSLATWTLGSGLNTVPAVGIQLQGTGSAIGTTTTATSQIFNLPTFAQQTFTLYATIDTSYITAGSVTVNLFDATTSALITTTSGNAYFTTPSSPLGITNYATTFTLSNIPSITSKDVYVQISFSSTLNIPAVSSVFVGNIGLVYGSYTIAQIANKDFDENFSWKPGGYFVQNSFTAARTVMVAPVDSNGIEISYTAKDTLANYLESYREANFIVEVIAPNYIPINVSWTANGQIGYDPNVVLAAGNAAIENFLNPANWAGGNSVSPFWDTTKNYIRVLDVAGILAGVAGISTVTSVNMQASTTYNSSTMSANDILLTGIAPMPIANYINGSVVPNTLNSTTSGF
jgi:hypothetical protein